MKLLREANYLVSGEKKNRHSEELLISFSLTIIINVSSNEIPLRRSFNSLLLPPKKVKIENKKEKKNDDLLSFSMKFNTEGKIFKPD